MRAALLLLLAAAPALAQDAGAQRELLQRNQATDKFNLQLRQSQDALKASPDSRSAVEARQLSDRQRLDNISNDQLRDVKTDAQTQPNMRPYELQNADRERAPFRGPVVEVPVKPAPKAEPLLPPQRGIQLETPKP